MLDFPDARKKGKNGNTFNRFHRTLGFLCFFLLFFVSFRLVGHKGGKGLLCFLNVVTASAVSLNIQGERKKIKK